MVLLFNQKHSKLEDSRIEKKKKRIKTNDNK